MLLTRDVFRNSIFERDNNQCVICKAPAKDAHHIIERRLFDDGGYYLDNGASLCADCHMKAEQTIISCDQIRESLNITEIVLPEDFYSDERYDKWGNIVLSNGRRLKGPLFFDESVQKVLEPVLDLFCSYIKYPRTYHLPWSETITEDDKRLQSIDHFLGKKVVITIKMDGEQSTLYKDYYHARSIDSGNHPSRTWIKNLHSQIGYDIPDNWRICGENLYAKHTIQYHNLESYFMVFSIWNDRNICLNWNDTIEWCHLLGLNIVPTLYIGEFNIDLIKSLYRPVYNDDLCEGYVTRLFDSFSYREFKNSVAKFVSGQFNNDITGRHNWKYEKLIQNELIK